MTGQSAISITHVLLALYLPAPTYRFSVFCKVQSAKESVYNVVSFQKAIASLSMTTIRSEIGSMLLDETLINITL
jgi:hypothetical protein